MSVPTTGFLTVNTNQPPVDFQLPVADTFSYSDGTQGTFTSAILGVDVLLDQQGDVTVVGQAGLVGIEFGFNILVSRHSVFSSVLIDSIDPALIPNAFSVEETIDVDEELEPCLYNFEVIDYDICCAVEDSFFWLFDGSVTLDSSRKWGTLA